MENKNTNRTYKSRIFEMIFSEKKELLELYNAVNGTDYEDPNLLEINTLENAIYMSMHNDISFIIDFRLNLYEHQSTYNPNLPLRFLFYISDLLSDMTKRTNLYGRRMISIPTPQFLVFYNGAEERPDREVMLLSSAFQVPDEDICLELKVVVLNINKGHNAHLLTACKTLQDYAEYTSRVRKYAEQMGIADAVERAVTECIRENILSEFLSKNRAEAIKVSIYEYDQEEHMRMEREESREEGLKEGLQKGLQEGMQQGIQQGVQQGIQQGMQQGIQQARLDMICRAIENGLDSDQLKNLLGATEDELLQCKKDILSNL